MTVHQPLHLQVIHLVIPNINDTLRERIMYYQSIYSAFVILKTEEDSRRGKLISWRRHRDKWDLERAGLDSRRWETSSLHREKEGKWGTELVGMVHHSINWEEQIKWCSPVTEWDHNGKIMQVGGSANVASINQTPWGGSTFQPLYSALEINGLPM